MDNLYNQLIAIQTRAAAIISDIPELAGYTVATEVKGDLTNQLTNALAKLGLCMVVLTPYTRILARNGQRVLRSVSVQIGCYESPILNSKDGVRVSALRAASLIAQAIEGAGNGQVPDEFDDELSGKFELTDDDITLVPDEKSGGIVMKVSAHTEISTINA